MKKQNRKSKVEIAKVKPAFRLIIFRLRISFLKIQSYFVIFFGSTSKKIFYKLLELYKRKDSGYDTSYFICKILRILKVIQIVTKADT